MKKTKMKKTKLKMQFTCEMYLTAEEYEEMFGEPAPWGKAKKPARRKGATR
jgi:hypothetical protein